MNRAVIGAAACAVVIAAAPQAAAHDSVIDAQPGMDATVTEFPEKLVLEFSGEPRQDFSTVALSRLDDAGRSDVLFTGEPEVDGRNVTLPVPGEIDAQPGTYRIGFQITSSDGHATKGMTSFTYAPAGEVSSGDQTQTSGESGELAVDDAPARNLTWLWLLLGVLLLGGVGVAAMGARQRNLNADKRIRDLDYDEKQPGNQYKRP